MTHTCKNCSNHFKGNFCFHCGQAANTHELNAHFLWHDIQHGIFHFDKGLLYSAKELFTRPGATIREYIHGKRAWHFKPISMLVLLATVYGLLYHYLGISPLNADFQRGFTEGFNAGGKKPPILPDFETINNWIGTHFAVITLVQMPFYALASWLAFRKSGYNYVEHLVLNSFLASQRLIVHILLLPFDYVFNKSTAVMYISTVVGILDFLLLVWSYRLFFNNYSTGKAILLSILSYVLVIVIFLIVVVIVSIIVGIVYGLLHRH